MDNYIDNVLINYKPISVEKHLDSSDFDETQIVPFISSKGGKHIIYNKTLQKHPKAKDKFNFMSYKNTSSNKDGNVRLFDENMIPVRDHEVNANHNRKKPNIQINGKLNSTGDNILHNEQQRNNSKQIKHKVTPCFSNIFRRSNNNNAKQIVNIKHIPENNLNSGKTFCADCERRRIKKLNRRRQSYVVQPVYAVDNVQRGPVPFGHANDRAPLLQHKHNVIPKQDSNTSYELTSSESEIGKTDQRKCRRRRQNFIHRLQKEMTKEYLKYEKDLVRNRTQQYPSKQDKPYQVFSTPYCQANIAYNNEESNIPSTSSGFWEYIFEKIRGKQSSEKDNVSKPCYCNEFPSLPQQHDETLSESGGRRQFESQTDEVLYKNQEEIIPECKSCLQQTKGPINERIKNPTTKSTQIVKCQCHSNKKNKKQNNSLKQPLPSMTQEDDAIKPCQEPHDDITKTVQEKYNGEILCIHNPPCILINGCLNLPPTKYKSPTQGNFWPIIQDKKSSFYHLCRKKRRSKPNCEQGCQYHPPSVEVQQALPIKTEKVVQSICNHDPPCEVVYGCYKAKYDSKLDNSCVHVPMCQRLPECVMERQERQMTDGLCDHKPKCAQLPLCSRKFIVLTARDTVGTQVRPKAKLLCRHEPPCIMIPQCLARIISDSCIPYETIPDCVHKPCCEMIPACCRKAAKEMVSVSSQYPVSQCPIV